MALVKLPILNGAEILLSANSVYRVAEGIAAAGSGGKTRVEFLGESQLTDWTVQQVATLLESAGATLVKLTDTDNRQVFLSASAIASVRMPAPGDPANAKSVVIVGGRKQAVQQTMDQIDHALADD